MHTEEIEIEARRKISEADFRKLIIELSPLKEIGQQTNYYFDTTDNEISNRMNGVLRVRDLAGYGKTLQLKLPLTNDHNGASKELHVKLENMDLFLSQPSSFCQQIGNLIPMNGLKGKQFQYLGRASSWRNEYPHNGGMIVLDRTKYLGNASLKDYRIEYEGKEGQDVEKILEDFLRSKGIVGEKCDSKFITMLNHKEKETI